MIFSKPIIVSSLLLANFVTFAGASLSNTNTCVVDNSVRTACSTSTKNYATLQSSPDECLAAGCCWMQQFDDKLKSANCYQPIIATEPMGYKLSTIMETKTGFMGVLDLLGKGNNVYGSDITQLKLDIVFHTEDVIEVKITDAKKARWEIPSNIIPRHQPKQLISTNYEVKWNENPFTLEIIRKSDQEKIFSFDANMVFKDQYIEFSVLNDNSKFNTYGFGESTRVKHALDINHIYTLWAADIGANTMYQNLYGSYPIYLQQRIASDSSSNVGNVHGGLLLNSNGMDVSILADRINYKVIGGVIDYFVFTGSTAQEVIAQSTNIIGKPAMVPYWSLGFHNCRWGYRNIDEVKAVVANYSAAQIPLDTQWVDIDHMEAYRDFTLSDANFPADQVQSFVKNLHDNGQHFVPIVDPGIMTYSGYDAYEKGLAMDIFIKDLQHNNYYAEVWPGPTHFPDFFHPKAQDYWTEQLKNFHDLVGNDGVWIDMNEISNFCNQDGTGQVCNNWDPKNCPNGCCLTCTTVDPTNQYDFPPYHINHMYGKLAVKTVAMSNLQYGNVSVYNTHNLYGLTEQIATNNAIASIRQKRPFVLSRSSFLSTGVHSAKWTGDNEATWKDLKSSIVSIMDFNIFSVPMIGADICGFNGETNEELCARWIEVGAFYPFSRDHNTVGALSQELYRWESVTQAAQNALGIRYQILPYFYTLFYDAHSKGTPVIQALWMNYPTDANTAAIDSQFMVGSSILVSPVLEQGATSVKAYFPKGRWYNFNGRKLAFESSGEWKELATSLTDVQVHVAGGSILPLQGTALTTSAGRQTPFTFLVALCGKNKAKGSLFWDDGEEIQLSRSLSLSFYAESGRFSSDVITNTFGTSVPSVGQIVVMSKDMVAPSTVAVNGNVLAANAWTFDETSSVLTVDVNYTIDKPFDIRWW